MSTPKRTRLIAAAQRLFAREGFKGTSVDTLLKEAGVAKMTLYKAFGTKDDLILETLRQRDTQLRQWLKENVDKAGPDPRDQLLACFDALQSWSEKRGFNGCYFVSALTEFSAETQPACRAAREHKRLMLDYVADLCEKAGLADPRSLAIDLRLLMEGATIAKVTLGQPDSYQRAKQMAQLRIKAAA